MSAIPEPDVGETDLTATDLRRQLVRVRRRYEREKETRRKSELIAEEALSRLYEADRAKSVFLATISHELRTPLTSIGGFTSLMLGSWDAFDDDVKLDFLNRINRNAESLHSMIEEVLDFAKLDEGQLAFHLEAVDVGALARNVVDDQARLLDLHEVSVECAPVVAAVDPQAFRRILVNLLSNASRYSPEGTRIRVGIERGESVALLTVSDNGPGIPETERELVFEPFFRGAHGHVIKTHGPGIGLTVVKRFVDGMGGWLELSGVEPTGLRARVGLPLA